MNLKNGQWKNSHGYVTLPGVQMELANMLKFLDDPEVFHGMEDALHGRVLRAIAGGAAEDPAALAAEALKTQGLTVARWYA
jgi:hypothetical protein